MVGGGVVAGVVGLVDGVGVVAPVVGVVVPVVGVVVPVVGVVVQTVAPHAPLTTMSDARSSAQLLLALRHVVSL